MDTSPKADVAAVQDISVIASILRTVLQTTGMGFAAVARVTEDRWLACEVLDEVGFGLRPGDELPVKTTLCDEVRGAQAEIVIDHVAEDPLYAEHHTPRLYGLQSYISVPIILADGSFFGTLCAIDAKPAAIKGSAGHHMCKLFAELIGRHLDDRRMTRQAQAELAEEKLMAELREQFMAVLGHDLKNPVAAVQAGARMLLKEPQSEKARFILQYLTQTAGRLSELADNVADLARCRMGAGVLLNIERERPLRETIEPIVEEACEAHPERRIEARYALQNNAPVDHSRLGQLLSNLLSNALVHGAKDEPIVIEAVSDAERFCLSVENGGEPIPETERGRLFQPYYRGDASRTKGLGIGLYIAAEIARTHRGRIELSCDNGRTTFVFTMPLTTARPKLAVVG